MSQPAAPASRMRPPGWLVALAFLLLWVMWDARAVTKHTLETSAQYGVAVDAPAVDPRSATGYADGRRSLLLPAGEADTAHWIMQTQAMIAHGDWRIRHVDYDNSPRGREVHWAAPLHWGLAALAWIDHAVSGRPIGISVERAALILGPVMLCLLLTGLLPFLSRRFSPIAATLVGVGAVTTLPFYIDFVPARADHHGLTNICCLLAVLFMLVGSSSTSRRWFIASALAGGIGLWISAATAAPMLVALGLGMLAATWIGRGAVPDLTWARSPALLRLWGWVGGATSFAAYLIEYFPAEMGLRLEVNHPLYALAWIGGGELLAAVALAAQPGKFKLTRRQTARAGVGAALVVLLPVVILLTKAQTFTVADPFVWRLHALHISEFQSLPREFVRKGFSWSSLEFVLPMFLLLPSLILFLRQTTPRETKVKIALVGVPALLAWTMGWAQIRWLSLAYAVSVPSVALWFRTLEAQLGKNRRATFYWAMACGLLLLPGATGAMQRVRDRGEATDAEIHSLAERDVAHWLRLRGGADRIVVASAPASATSLIYLGGLDGVGTLYWENAEGLKNAAALFDAPSAEAAQEIAERLKITHIVLFSWDAFEVSLAKLHRGLPETAPIPDDCFIANLLKSPVPPPWLRAIPFKLPNHPSLKGTQVRIWEVSPERSPAEAIAHAANYYLELGMPEIGAKFGPLLAEQGTDLTALTMLAGLASRQHDDALFSKVLEQIVARLSRAEQLRPDDHVHLVVVLAVAGRAELARTQLQSCLRKLDERSLRHLTPGTLSDLLTLTEAFGLELPSPSLHQLAQQLVPPAKRK